MSIVTITGRDVEQCFFNGLKMSGVNLVAGVITIVTDRIAHAIFKVKTNELSGKSLAIRGFSIIIGAATATLIFASRVNFTAIKTYELLQLLCIPVVNFGVPVGLVQNLIAHNKVATVAILTLLTGFTLSIQILDQDLERVLS